MLFRALVLGFVVTMIGAGNATAQDMLQPGSPVGQQWRRATLFDPRSAPLGPVAPIMSETQTARDLARAPVWARIRKLVEGTPNSEALLKELDEENLVKLISTGGSFTSPQTDAKPKADGKGATDPGDLVK